MINQSINQSVSESNESFAFIAQYVANELNGSHGYHPSTNLVKKITLDISH